MAKKINQLTAQPSTPADSDLVAWGQAAGSGLAYKMTFTQLKAKLDAMGGAGDTTAPIVVSATATSANTIVVVFSESVTVTTSGWSFKLNGANWAISSVSGSGSTWTFTMATSGASTDTILRSYNSATGSTVDTSANELVTFTDQSVTNSIPAGGSYDSDAQAFFTAAAITDNTQKDAVNGLVVALKAASIWTKMYAIYPMVGGTAAAHKFNLKDPRDLDAAFRLVFNGTLTHSANGITPGGTTADYADTKFIPDTALTVANSAAIGYYVRSLSGDQQLMGAFVDGGLSDTYQMATYAGLFYGQIGMVTDAVTVPSPVTKLIIGSRTGATTTTFYRDGTSFKSSTLTYDDTCTVPIYLFGRNNNSTNDSAGNVPCSFAFISDGLDGTEVTALNNAVNTFQTALSRGV